MPTPQLRDQDDAASEETHGKVDPAAHPIDLALGQANVLTSGIADYFIGQASRLRDQLDELIRQQKADAAAEAERAGNYASRTRERADTVKVMSEAFRELAEPTAAKVPPTVTQLPRERRAS